MPFGTCFACRSKKHGNLGVSCDASVPGRWAAEGWLHSNGTLLDDILFIGLLPDKDLHECHEDCLFMKHLREFGLLVQGRTIRLVKPGTNGSITAFRKTITPPDFEGITCDEH